MSPATDDPQPAPMRRLRRVPQSGVTDPHCEHCGGTAHFVPTAGHWIHRYGDESCGYHILKPTEGRLVFERPPLKAQKVSIYLNPSQEPGERGDDRPKAARRRLNKSQKAKPKARWS